MMISYSVSLDDYHKITNLAVIFHNIYIYKQHEI